jgi:hypothetical protein
MSTIFREVVGWIMLAALVVTAVWFAMWEHRRETTRDAVVTAQIASLDSAIAHVVQIRAHVDTQYLKATTIYYTTHDSAVQTIVQSAHDSVSKQDALTMLHDDSLHCAAALVACEARVQAADSATALWRTKAQTVQSLMPSRTENAINTGAKLFSAATLLYFGLHLLHP